MSRPHDNLGLSVDKGFPLVRLAVDGGLRAGLFAPARVLRRNRATALGSSSLLEERVTSSLSATRGGDLVVTLSASRREPRPRAANLHN